MSNSPKQRDFKLNLSKNVTSSKLSSTTSKIKSPSNAPIFRKINSNQTDNTTKTYSTNLNNNNNNINNNNINNNNNNNNSNSNDNIEIRRKPTTDSALAAPSNDVSTQCKAKLLTSTEQTLKDFANNTPKLSGSKHPVFDVKVRKTLKLQPPSKVTCLDWHPDSRHLCSGYLEGHIAIWDSYSHKVKHNFDLRCPCILTCCFPPVVNPKVIAFGGLDNRCSLLCFQKDMRCTNPCIFTKEAIGSHTSYVSSSAFLGSDQQLLSGSGDGTCILWDLEKYQLDQTFRFQNSESEVSCLDPSPANPWKIFVSGGSNESCYIWDIRTGNCEQMFCNFHVSDINTVKFFPTGDSIVTGSDDSTCKMFDLRANKQLQDFSKETILFGVSAIDVSISGRLLFVAHEDCTINIWDIIYGERIMNILNFHEECVTCLKRSNEGAAICTGSWDSTLKIW